MDIKEVKEIAYQLINEHLCDENIPHDFYAEGWYNGDLPLHEVLFKGKYYYDYDLDAIEIENEGENYVVSIKAIQYYQDYDVEEDETEEITLTITIDSEGYEVDYDLY